MPAPQERDLNKATEDFKNWLINEKDQDASIIVEVLGGPENTGFSNETLSFNVTQGMLKPLVMFCAFIHQDFWYFLNMILKNSS